MRLREKSRRKIPQPPRVDVLFILLFISFSILLRLFHFAYFYLPLFAFPITLISQRFFLIFHILFILSNIFPTNTRTPYFNFTSNVIRKNSLGESQCNEREWKLLE